MSGNAPLGLLVGTSLLESGFLDDFREETLRPGDEPVTVYCHDGVVALQRHRAPGGEYRAPHAIRHRDHMVAMRERGVRRIVSVQSAGSLRESLEPGSLVVPDDFLNPWQVVTSYDDGRGHRVVEFDGELRGILVEELGGDEFEAVDGGVYVQTRGPRFESPAEARMLARFGDLVGMTAASELIHAHEQGLGYATLCSVDNYVNGIAGTRVSLDSFRGAVEDHRERVVCALEAVLARLLEPGDGSALN